jgi:hypothetical protein
VWHCLVRGPKRFSDTMPRPEAEVLYMRTGVPRLSAMANGEGVRVITTVLRDDAWCSRTSPTRRANHGTRLPVHRLQRKQPVHGCSSLARRVLAPAVLSMEALRHRLGIRHSVESTR